MNSLSIVLMYTSIAAGIIFLFIFYRMLPLLCRTNISNRKIFFSFLAATAAVFTIGFAGFITSVIVALTNTISVADYSLRAVACLLIAYASLVQLKFAIKKINHLRLPGFSREDQS